MQCVFSDYALDTWRYELRRSGRPIPLRSSPDRSCMSICGRANSLATLRSTPVWRRSARR
jgi:hypothetical protein